MKTTLAVALLAFSTIQVFPQSLNLLEPSAKRKVDPLLQQSILTKERFPEQAVTAIEYHAAGTRAEQQVGDMVGVIIESSADITQYVRSMGGIVGSKHGNVYTALIPTTAIGRVAQQSAVRYIEASRHLFPSLDLSIAKTGADVLHSFADTTKRLTGKGVIIGFTDTGINTDHPNFKTPDGKTRILYVWDQYSSGGGSPPAGFTYGIEKDSAAINAHAWSMFDGGAHGTHVAGIAAGNGLPSKQYVGMAPEADIVMVSNFGDDLFNRGLTTVGTLDGYDYIRGKANSLGKRFVINTSQGTNLGPHDGTSLFEKAINADVGAGGILALAAGNEATSARHASAVVTASTPQQVDCYVSSGYSIPMDIWYEANDRLVLRIKEADDASFEAVFPPVDSTIVYAFDWAIVSVTTKMGSPLNGDNEIYINFRAFSDVTMQLEFSVAPGNALPDGGRVDLWWERNYYVQFLTHVDKSITFGVPAGADSAITVASYNNRTGSGLVDDISTFSGVGPRRDGALKPDISGLGGMVMSSIFSSGYDMFSGTSMSSPHVAGAVALLLQQDPTLASYGVRQKLITSATADAFTGPVPNPVWGYGKLNVLKAAGYKGTALVSLEHDTVDFGSALVQFTKYDSVRIGNLGNGDLTLTSVTPSSGIFSAAATPFFISPHSFAYFRVSVTPLDTGAFSGYLDIASDDSTQPVVRITLLGRGDYLPVAGISPDSLVYVVNEGERATQNITIANTGQGPLKFEIGIDFPPPASPGTRPVRASTSAKWGHVSDELSVHSSLKAVFASTPLLPIIVQDSIGDGTGVDISEIRGLSGEGRVTLQLVLASPFNPSDFGGYLGLDLDQNPATGMPLPSGAIGQDVGCEFYVEFFGISAGVDLYDSLGYWKGTFAPELDVVGNKFTFSIPLDVLNHDDGKINIASILGTSFGPTDWAPNEGHGVVGLSWITADPSGGSVAPAGSVPVPVRVNTGDLSAGSYFARLVITTNDTGKTFTPVPIHLTVNLAPNLLVADSIQFGQVYVGFPDTVAVVLQNNGTPGLTISGMTVNNAQFTILDPTDLNFIKDQKRTVRIRCNPTGPGILSAQLTITSNDPDTPVLSIPVTASAEFPPVIALSPSDSLQAAANEGDTAAVVMTISNTGSSELQWEVLKKDSSAPHVLIWTGFVADTFEVAGIKNAIWSHFPKTTFEQTTTLSQEGIASLLEKADVFLWPRQGTIGNTAAEILGTGFASVLSSFANRGKTILVIDYSSVGASFLKGTGLLNIGGQSGLQYMTATVHDTFSPLVKDVSPMLYLYGSYHSSSDGKKIIREQSTGSNIVTQRRLGAGSVIYVGMEAYNVFPDMARLLSNAAMPAPSFISFSPSTGTVASAASQDVSVMFSAMDLPAGTYRDLITVQNNDPLRNPKILAAVLSVTGKPVIQVKPESIVGVTAHVGIGRKDTLRVKNAGSELLSVTAVTASDTATFKADKTSFFVVPYQEAVLVITTTRSDTGSYSGQITLTSNDTKTLVVTVRFAGHAIHAPVMTLTPDSVVVTIDEGDSTATTLTIGNTGLGDLKWNINGPTISTSLSEGQTRTQEEISVIQEGQRARPGNNKGTPTVGLRSINMLLSTAGGKRVLLWTGYSDNSPGGEAENTMNAIRQFAPDVSFVQTMTESASELSSLLSAADVFIMPEQENKYELDYLGARFASTLTSFLQYGKTMVVLDFYETGATRFLKGTQLLDVAVMGGGVFTAVVHDASSPLVKDLPDSFTAMDGSSYNTSANGKKIVRELNSGNNVVTQRDIGAGRLIYIGMDFYSYNSDMARLLANAVVSAMGNIVSVSPDSGTVLTGGSQEVTVAMNAKYLPGGEHRIPLVLNSNDPLRNSKNIPVVLNVVGKPRIELKPDSITGITAYVAVLRTDTLRVRNSGSGLLVVNGITSSDTSVFKPSRTSFYVLPDQEEALAVRTTASDTGLFRGVITIASNDTKHPAATFVLAGHSIYPPVLTLAPDSLSVTVNEGDSAKRTVTVGNAGLTDLHWKIEGAASEASLAPGQVPSGSSNSEKTARTTQGGSILPRLSVPWGNQRPKETAVSRAGEIQLTSTVLLPVVVKDPVGDASGVDISEIRGMSSGEVTLQLVLATPLNPFDFAGYLGFDLDQNVTTGTTLPFAVTGQDVGCEYFVTFFNISSGIFLYDQAGNFKGQFTAVLDISGKTVTFSIPLTALDNDDGVMNIAAVLGTGYGPTDWVPDVGHGVLQSWIFADLTEGVVPPGATQDVVITMDARKLRGGNYRQVVNIRSDDPLRDPTEMPVALTVIGKPRVQLQPDSIVGVTAHVGVQRKDTLRVTNIGSVALAVSKVTSSDTSKFKVDTTAFNLAAGVTKSLVITTTMKSLGSFSGVITVLSNDAKRPAATFVLAGTAEHPSVMVVTPASFTVMLDQLDSVSRTMTISNTGLGTLQWEVAGASSAGNAIPAELLRSEEERAAIQERQAQNKGNNSDVPTVGPYSMNTLLSIPGTRRILLWTGFADTTEGGEVENTMNAIRQYMPDVRFEQISTTSSSEFAGRLNESDIFIMPEQERTGNLSALGSSFASALASFVQNGKTMIVLDFFWGYDSVSSIYGASTSFLNAAGLLSISIKGYGQFTVAAEDLASPLAKDLPPSFLAMDGANYHSSTNGRRIVRDPATNFNVVTQRDVGAGRVIYIGMDFYSYNRHMARLLSNAVSSSKGSFLSTLPGTGTIPPGGSQEVTVAFNGKNIPNGTYVSSLLIYNNDPLRNPLAVPVTLQRTIVGVEDVVVELPEEFALHQNYPNPFNPETRIQYDLPKMSFVTMEVYNILGERVMVLANEEQPAGYHSVVWNGQAGTGTASSGVYLVRIQAGEYVKTIKMVLLR